MTAAGRPPGGAAGRWVVVDTRDLWIHTQRDSLIAALGMVHGAILNDGEARLLPPDGATEDGPRGWVEVGHGVGLNASLSGKGRVSNVWLNALNNSTSIPEASELIDKFVQSCKNLL